jgi:hypothetical protein
MRFVLFVALLFPVSAFAEESVGSFENLLTTIGQCSGTYAGLIKNIAADSSLSSDEKSGRTDFTRHQEAILKRVQAKAIQNYLGYLKASQPSSQLTAKSMEDRANTISRDIAKEKLSSEVFYQRAGQCVSFIQRAFADVFIFHPLSKEGEPDSAEIYTNAVKDYGNWMSCNVVMDKDKAANGDQHAKVISGLKLSSGLRGTMVFEGILVNTDTVEEDDIVEFLDTYTRTVVSHAANNWDNANAEQQKAQVKRCVRLNQSG